MDDDPFAELTRIMGHDPRRVEAPKADLDAARDDLALELENELLGDLNSFSEADSDDAPANDSWQPPQADWRFEPPSADSEPEAPADLADELDETFAATFEEEIRADAAGEDEAEPPTDWLDDVFATDTAAQAEPDDDPSAAGVEPSADPFEADRDGAAQDVTFGQDDWAQLDADFDEAAAEPASAAPHDEAPVEQNWPDSQPAYEPEAEAAAYDAQPPAFADDAAGEDAEESGPEEPAAPPADEARQYMSPQDFASSVARGAQHSSIADDGAADTDAVDLASAFEAEFGLRDDAPVEAVVEDRDAVGEDIAAAPMGWEPDQADEVPEQVAEAPALSWHQPEPLPQPAHSGPPLIDTVGVPGDERVLVEEAAHIPEFHSEPAGGPEAGVDDLELALARAFGDAEIAPEPAPAAAQKPGVEFPHDQFATAALGGADEMQADEFAFEQSFADDFDKYETAAVGYDQADDYPAADDGAWNAQPPYAPAAQAAPLGAAPLARLRQVGGGRGMLIAAAVGGVAVLGAIAAFALGTGGSDAEAPVLVRADSEPVKVKPENPGGQTVPNQDNQVYQRVSGAEAAGKPEQERLVTTVEEPVEVPAPKVEQVPPKSEERLAAAPEQEATTVDEAITAMAPRRVRTMVVRPDGTLVPREETVPAEQPAAAARAEPQQPAATPLAEGQDATPPAVQTPTVQTAAVEAPEQPAAAAETTAATVNVPASAPVPSRRPAAAPAQSRQPAAAAPTRVAAAPAQPTQPAAQAPAAADGGWSVQISSQPTAESAQQSYQDMAQRHGNLLTGRGVNIVKAEVAGKGTYYRVRIPSRSKDDAIQLCSQLKAAGGSCFVSK